MRNDAALPQRRLVGQRAVRDLAASPQLQFPIGPRLSSADASPQCQLLGRRAVRDLALPVQLLVCLLDVVRLQRPLVAPLLRDQPGCRLQMKVAASAKAVDLEPLRNGEEAQNGSSVHVVVCNCVRPDRFHLLVSFLKQNCSWALSFHTCKIGMEGTRTCLDQLADKDLGDAAHDDRHVQVDLLPHNRLLQLHRRAA